MIHTPVCDLLGIQYPVLQGGMAWIADAELAAAVSNAGGLGIISAMNAGGDWVREQIRKTKTMTSKPFGVNIMLASPHVEEIAQIVMEEQVPVVTTGAGNPSKYMKAWLNAGIQVIPVVASTGMAKLAARNGASAVIAEGGESGGHVGELTTMVLVPQVCDSVDIPVIAAGGIADGRGMAAAFALGASGIQMGTAFLVAKECNVHPNYKEKVLKAKDIDTMTTGRRSGHPVRVLKNQFARDYAKLEWDSTVSDETLEQFGSGSLRKAAIEGETLQGSFMCGQIAGMIQQERTAAEIIDSIMKQTEQLMTGGCPWVK